MDYNLLAPTYDDRYAVSPLGGIAAALRGLAAQFPTARILEAGCGTGHWLKELEGRAALRCGIDPSPGMLGVAQRQAPGSRLVGGVALDLPFAVGSFDLLFCVNAIHHFGGPAGFVAEARRVLRAGGILAVVGIDPRSPDTHWYVYHTFPQVLQRDLRRFPDWTELAALLAEAGFSRLEQRPVERSGKVFTGAEVFEDPFLRQHQTSQLASLTPAEYAAGLERMRAEIESAKKQGQEFYFRDEIPFFMLSGHRS